MLPTYAFPADADLAGRRILVMGLGLFGGGEAVVRFLIERGAHVTVTDLRASAALAEPLARLADLRFSAVLGRHDPADFVDADALVVGPGVDPASPFVRIAIDRGVPLLSEIGLCLSRLRGRQVWVTGSKGKSTTTALIHAMAQAAGCDAWLGGNVGRSLLPHLGEIGDASVVALEISSFQLEQLWGWPRHPEVAVITNLFPIHLDRHGDFDTYCRVKETALQGARVAVLCGDDPRLREIGSHASAAVHWFGRDAAALDLRLAATGELCERAGGAVLDGHGLRLRGDHNRLNAMAALLAAQALGVPRAIAASAALSFPGLPHRLELVGERAGVRYFNDSIATSPRAVAAAISAIAPEGRPMLLLLGGKDNGAVLDDLVGQCGRVRAIIGFGEAGIRCVAALRHVVAGPSFADARDLEAAMDLARRLAGVGDSVLMSPGFPSFDQFRNFEERGERFRALAMQP